jgi:hypothetical protein
MRRFALILALASSPAFLAGCKNPCRQLAEKLCDCEPNTSARESCLRDASARDSKYSPTDVDQARCDALLAGDPGCRCEDLTSADSAVRANAKKNCGLANQ